MGKIKQAVFDAGPFIHLHEIDQFELTKQFLLILITKEILSECSRIKNDIKILKNLTERELNGKGKDFAKYLTEKFSLDLGEATGIALCKQEKVKLFFTDDLEARTIASRFGFEPHGTIAIILRAFRKGIIDKKKTKVMIENLYQKSSLFFSSDLKQWTLREIDRFSQS